MRSLWFVMLALVSATWIGCAHEEEPAPTRASGAAAVELGSDVIVEEHDDASIAWSVAPDGNVRAQVRAKDGTVVREKVSGKVEWAPPAVEANVKAEARVVPLEVDGTTGVLFAVGPKLEADLTPIRYSIDVSGKALSGTLHVPVEGTAALVANAKASVSIEAPKVKIGPHRGVIQIVGKEYYEIVSDDVSGEVRVYLLDADFKATVLGDRRITLGVFAGVPSPDLFVLTSVEGGLYARASWGVTVDPFRITMAVRTAASAAFAVVGLMPDLRINLRVSAPRVHVRVKGAFDGDVDADLRARAKVNVHSDNGVRDHGAGLGRHGDDKMDVHAKANVDAKSHVHSGSDRGKDDHGGGKSGSTGKSNGGKSDGGKSGGGKSGGGSDGKGGKGK